MKKWLIVVVVVLLGGSVMAEDYPHIRAKIEEASKAYEIKRAKRPHTKIKGIEYYKWRIEVTQGYGKDKKLALDVFEVTEKSEKGGLELFGYSTSFSIPLSEWKIIRDAIDALLEEK